MDAFDILSSPDVKRGRGRPRKNDPIIRTGRGPGRPAVYDANLTAREKNTIAVRKSRAKKKEEKEKETLRINAEKNRIIEQSNKRKSRYYNDKIKKTLLNGGKKELKIDLDLFLKTKDATYLLRLFQEYMARNPNEISNVNFNNNHYTLTPENIKKLIDITTNGEYVEEVIIKPSDADVILFLIDGENAIYFNSELKTNIYNNTEGAFFNYYLKRNINIDLSESQIYKKHCEFQDKNRNTDNCLLYALKLSGIKEENLEVIKDMIKLKHIPVCDLEIICKKLKICIILWKLKSNNEVLKIKYGKKYKSIVDIGYIDNHYFLVKKTKYNEFAIKNYEKLKDEPNFNLIYNKRLEKSKRFINTFKLISIMMENKTYFFDKIDAGNINILDELYLNKLKENSFTNLEYDEENETNLIIQNVESKKEKKEIDIKFFDFETVPVYENNQQILKPILCWYVDDNNIRKHFIGDNCAYKMLKSLENDTLLIAHNAKFDNSFLTKYLTNASEISNNGAFITFNGYFNKVKISIKDSYKLIPMKLSDFPKAFKLNYDKEFMPYNLYNEENVKQRFIDYNEVLEYITNEEDKETFDKNVKNWNLRSVLDFEKIDMIEYCSRYCEIDVLLLKDGYNIFRKNCIEYFNIDINEVLTIPSFADKYLINEGCYNDVYELSGQPRQFIEKCIVGGRTMCENNKKIIKEKAVINDFDAVSLYPSAMYRLNGFLKGKPKVLKTLDYEIIKKYDGYFIEILVKNVKIKRNFPLASITDNGIRNFTNDLIGKKIYVDKTSLEDLIEFQGFEFDVIKGYYFNDGFNSKIVEVINFIFNKRLELKECGNVAQLIYKLIMNSAYGKTIQKSHDTTTKLFNNDVDFKKFLSKNYNTVNSWNYYGEKVRATIAETITNHFNRAHIGVQILSMSKRIMNEVICLAEDNNLNIYYQDTDSIHIDDSNIKILEEKFKQKYNKDLIGSNMGQFHSDFELKGATKDIKSTASIFLGKKSYIDVLSGKNDDNKDITGYHIRMKGIPRNAIDYKCKQDKINHFELYKKLYNGEEVEFDLTCGGSAFKIKHNKDYSINVIKKFTRKVKF